MLGTHAMLGRPCLRERFASVQNVRQVWRHDGKSLQCWAPSLGWDRHEVCGAAFHQLSVRGVVVLPTRSQRHREITTCPRLLEQSCHVLAATAQCRLYYLMSARPPQQGGGGVAWRPLSVEEIHRFVQRREEIDQREPREFGGFSGMSWFRLGWFQAQF
jgi:hypothetical protein